MQQVKYIFDANPLHPSVIIPRLLCSTYEIYLLEIKTLWYKKTHRLSHTRELVKIPDKIMECCKPYRTKNTWVNTLRYMTAIRGQMTRNHKFQRYGQNIFVVLRLYKVISFVKNKFKFGKNILEPNRIIFCGNYYTNQLVLENPRKLRCKERKCAVRIYIWMWSGTDCVVRLLCKK